MGIFEKAYQQTLNVYVIFPMPGLQGKPDFWECRMFRLFLVNLLQSGKELDKALGQSKNELPPKRLRNRRIFDRFDIDHKHLSLMNDQDILLVRDLSERGFSTEVSERGFKRLIVGDVYLCRIRYLGEIYEAQAGVRWKSKGFVGFEILKTSRQLKQFMRRLIRPIEIGTSLQKVDDRYIQMHDNEGMNWYHGADETNFYLWEDDVGELRSWKLESTDKFIKWDPVNGLTTGKMLQNSEAPDQILTPWQQVLQEDGEPDPDLKQFAADVFMAIQHDARDQLIKSVMG